MQNSLIVYGFENVFKRKDMFDPDESEAVLNYYASDVFLEFGFTSFSDFRDALQKAFTILNSAKIPVKNHMKIVFRDQNHQIYQDWKLSSLACHLLKINGALDNRNVVEYQIKMHSFFQD
ncbi:hypothetical protein [Algoriphagus marinus]|uniref:hypothetical protein n=1 Tax=Algoriphagus marinus TaxID=1925762 RepID=UPI00094B792C|nr:hypothetical protein [Algoriphagus marinus]